MDMERIRDRFPPDWSDRYKVVASASEEDEAGPSDYAKREWLAGMKDRKWRCEECDLELEGNGLVDGISTPLQYSSSRIVRRRSPIPPTPTLASLAGSEGHPTDDLYRDNRENGRTLRKGKYRSSTISSTQRRTPIPLLPLLSLSLIPLVSAAPPMHTRPTSSPTSNSRSRPSRPTRRALHTPLARENHVAYITSAAPPSALPSDVVLMDETALPYIVTQGSDGLYTKVDDGWRLYGRQSGESPVFAGDSPAATTSSWAIEEALPPGWGVQSSRTDLYRVPLIVIASIIIAVGLVVAIIIVVLKRKKAHRRAKRRAERKRRKALAAAGLSEDTRNESEAQLQEKLEDLQRQHRAKRKGEIGVVSSPTARSKVRSWRAGLLRRRKGKNGDDEGEETIVVGTTTGDGNGQEDEVVDIIVEDNGRGSQDTGDTSATATEPITGTSIPSQNDEIIAQPPNTPTPAPPAPPIAGSTTYFPPAYRPASVRSINRAGPSEPSTSTSLPILPTNSLPGAEKVHAPGYYPAPATAEGEAALAVASRSEGKSRLIPPPSPGTEDEGEVEERGHAATDDKRVLERMRMAASAPPLQGGEGGDGPSAPGVEVDGDGFERFSPIDIQEGSSRLDSPILERQNHHPALPAPPPQQPLHRSYSVEREVHEQLDELNLLPSAPPLASPSDPNSTLVEHTEDAIPSAPPLMDDDEEEEETGPSAPPLPSEEDEGQEGEETLDEEDQNERSAAEEEEEAVVEARRPSEAPTLFLPKYEP